MKRLQRLWALALAVWDDFARHQGTLLASAIAFNATFALFPLLLGLIALLGFFVTPEWAQEQVLHRFGGVIPPALSFVPTLVVDLVRARGPAGLVSLVLLLWSARNLFLSLAQAVDIVWETPADPSWLAWGWRQIEAILCAVGLGGAAIVSTLVYGVVAWAMRTPRLLGHWPGVGLAHWLLANLAPVVLLAASLVAGFRFLPARRMSWKALAIGASFAAIAWELTRRLFGLYVAWATNLSLVYGPLAGLVLLMFWIYLSAVFVLLGAELSHQIEGRPTQATNR